LIWRWGEGDVRSEMIIDDDQIIFVEDVVFCDVYQLFLDWSGASLAKIKSLRLKIN
jgi:hypothetical protein